MPASGAEPAGVPPPSAPGGLTSATVHGTELLSLRHAAKAFGAVQALADGSIELYAGEAHALVGENGAGKSTLVKILAGVHQPDSGTLLIDGKPAVLHGPAAARDAGIAVIYQEPTLFPDLTVAENIFMGRQPLRAGRRIDGRAMRARAAELFGRLGVPLDPARICRGLSIADQQIVEIGKALSLNARVIVMDEPTAALSALEVARLFDVVRTLRAAGAAVLFISHRLEEVFEICQRVTVMRDGRHVLTSELAGLTADDLVRAMVGRDMPDRSAGEQTSPGELVLSVERLTREGVFTDISFGVRAGEIVAFAGPGRIWPKRGRQGDLRNRPLRRGHRDGDRPPAAPGITGQRDGGRRGPGARGPPAAGPGDGHVHPAEHDACLPRRLRRAGLMSAAAERAFATDWATRLRIKYGRLTDPVARLSGGNQQKVVLGKWLGRKPALLIVDEPTRGIDIATKAEVHRLLAELAADGVAILMISSELPEVLHVSDRILVMREGRLTAEYARADASEEKIMSAATGQLRAQAP